MQSQAVSHEEQRSVSLDGLSQDEQFILEGADSALSKGRQLKEWFDQARANDGFTQKFGLTFTFNRPDFAYGFLGVAPVDGQPMPVLGDSQGMFYDQPKSPTSSEQRKALWMRDQIRQFVLRYFMRVSDYRQPQVIIDQDYPPPPPLLGFLDWCPREQIDKVGFGFSQLFFKEKGSGRIGRFAEEKRFAIVDLRTLGTEFDWIICKVKIFGFGFGFQLLGPDGPTLQIPLSEESYLVLSRDFISDTTNPEGSDKLGTYGIGYAFIESPGQSVLAYGPGRFEAAYQVINFEVFRNGRTRACMDFVANRPTQIVNIPLNPLALGSDLAGQLGLAPAAQFLSPFKAASEMIPFADQTFDPVLAYVNIANLLSGGAAARNLCISKEELERVFLIKHFEQHYQTVAGSLLTWRQIRDWLDTKALPRWVITGVSA